MKAIACAALAYLAAAAPASAQAPGSPPTLTLSEAFDRALAANPTIVAARMRRAIDVAGLDVSRERLNPEASVEFARETPRQSYGVSVPIELGGKRDKRIAVGEATIRSGEAEIASTIAQVRNDVRRAYFTVVVANARLELMNDVRAIAVRVRDTAQQRFDAGSAPRLEVLQAQLSLDAAQNETDAAQSVALGARAALNALLGEPLDRAATLATPVDPGEAVTTDAAVTLARSANAELTVLDRQIDEQRAKLDLAAALRVPDVVPTAALTHDAAPEFDYGWRAGVAVTVPIFTTHRAGVNVERATLERLFADRAATLARVTGEVTATAVAAESQRQLYVRYRDQIIPQAQQVEQLAQDAYQLGQTGLVALLQSLQSTRDVRLRALDAIAQYHTALADLERAIGAPLP